MEARPRAVGKFFLRQGGDVSRHNSIDAEKALDITLMLLTRQLIEAATDRADAVKASA